MAAGLTAGAFSAIVAALVSLPLRSPEDFLLNTATVVLGALAAGAAAGVLWNFLGRRPRGLLKFAILWATGLVLSALLAVGGQTQLDHFLGFILPLAVIVFPLTGVLTVILARTQLKGSRWLAVVVMVVALAVGIGLSGQGDEETGKLELPPRASSSDGPKIPVLS